MKSFSLSTKTKVLVLLIAIFPIFQNFTPSGKKGHVASRVLVQFKPGTGAQAEEKILAAHGGRKVKEIGRIRVHIVELPSSGNEQAVAAALE